MNCCKKIFSLIFLYFIFIFSFSAESYAPKGLKVYFSEEKMTIKEKNRSISIPQINKILIEKNWSNIPKLSLESQDLPLETMKEILQLSDKFGFRINPDYLNLYKEIDLWLGTRYKWAGKSHKGIDCSGFTNMLYEKVFNKEIDRISYMQAMHLKKEISKDELKPGDLVFFATNRRRKNKISHVGIYIGNGYFAHASSHSGVTINNLSDQYYATRYVTGGEV